MDTSASICHTEPLLGRP
ncbi:hypothetical protein CJF31_00011400 [Rutstroemia sp. NJR-2017a BVV2]|nr:hypothetical protein CJF31_00011400 [Rutstroemia sp. NJR-2017a BVV2]